MNVYRIKAAYGHYEVEDGHLAIIDFAVTEEMLKHSRCDALGPMYRMHRLPDGCSALRVDEQWEKAFGGKLLVVRITGATNGHYKFVPEPECAPA